MDTKYFYSDINLDITHRCVLQCPRCLRQQHPGMHKRGYDITIESFLKICDHFKSINFCGQMGDCIYHPKFLELLNVLVKGNIFDINKILEFTEMYSFETSLAVI